MPRPLSRTVSASVLSVSAPAAEEALPELRAQPGEAVETALPASTTVYRVGDYLIGDGEEVRLGGHPDIRY